tara:strand:+ start:2468 stop:3469 length:1002 start_codon:yes stop_codon:yes gene_type:complete
MNKLIIIAEAGVNHNGNLKNAIKLVDIASKAKADYIKFQTYVTEELVQKKFSCARYQRKGTNFNDQYKMLKKYELKKKDFNKIIKRCKEKRIKFLSSPFDIQSVQLLNTWKLKTIKIPSGEITNIPYLKEIGKLKKNVILSTGMSNLAEIREAIKILTKSGTKKENISLLHCNSEYPVEFSKTNLNSIIFLRNKFKCNTGFSDHTQGFEAALVSIGLGANIIEKHFTINKLSNGPDHKSSLNGAELIKFVEILRKAHQSRGIYKKEPSKKEIENSRYVRKNIIASKKIYKGQKFSKNNLTTKRSKPGIPSSEWDKIINKRARYNFQKDQIIKI